MSQVAVSPSFQEKMRDRIKEGIGDLLSDEDLSKMVNSAMQEVFFAPRYVRVGFGKQKELPPLLHELVQHAATPLMQQELEKWLQEHGRELLPIIQRTIQAGVANAMKAAFEQQFSDAFTAFGVQIEEQIRSNLSTPTQY